MKDLKSSDVEVNKRALEKADSFMAALEEPCRTKVNKTTINTNPSRQDSLVKTCTLSRSRTDAQSHSPCQRGRQTQPRQAKNRKKHTNKQTFFLFLLFHRICPTTVQVSIKAKLLFPCFVLTSSFLSRHATFTFTLQLKIL